MTVPLRKDDPSPNQLTTADLANANRTADVSQREVQELRPQPTRPELSTSQPDPGKRPLTPSEIPSLFPDQQLHELQTRWEDIQTGFVDEPRSAVERADGLVAHAMQQLAEAFSRERAKLEHQWDHGDNISTEDLRVALQRYRSFFRRLLSI